jgi:hypothetical protein
MKLNGKNALICGALSLFLSIQLASAIPPTFPPQTKSEISSFWDWFNQYHSKFSKDKNKRDKFVSDVVDRIREVSPNLTVEIAPGEIDTMAISADGIEADFPLVEEMVAKAPAISGWRIVAFRPPGKLSGVILSYPDLTLDPDKMWILPIDNKDGFDLIVYFPDYTDAKRNLFINASYILLDDAIGEYNTVKGIRTLDFQKLPPSSDRAGIRPFTELPKVFADYKAKHHG